MILLKKINIINIEPGCKMILFDVKKLYIHQFLNLKHSIFTKIYLFLINILTQMKFMKLYRQLMLLINQNYFQYNNQLYTQK